MFVDSLGYADAIEYNQLMHMCKHSATITSPVSSRITAMFTYIVAVIRLGLAQLTTPTTVCKWQYSQCNVRKTRRAILWTNWTNRIHNHFTAVVSDICSMYRQQTLLVKWVYSCVNDGFSIPSDPESPARTSTCLADKRAHKREETACRSHRHATRAPPDSENSAAENKTHDTKLFYRQRYSEI